MGEIKSYRDLIFWQKAMDMAVQIYKLVAELPTYEKFGMTSQLTRAAMSVAANVAEGNGRAGSKQYANFLSIARGSLMETETYLLLAVRLEYLSEASIAPTMSITREIDRMLCGLRNKLIEQRGGRA